MPDKAWKKFERRVARFFGIQRNPLSGSNSSITASDTQHSELFIECKCKPASFVHTLHKETRPKAKKENKIPVLAIQNRSSPGFLLCIHSNDFEKVCQIFLKGYRWMQTEKDFEKLTEGTNNGEKTKKKKKRKKRRNRGRERMGKLWTLPSS